MGWDVYILMKYDFSIVLQFSMGSYISTITKSSMQECIRGALKEKTVILVTHQVDFLHNADLILVCHIIPLLYPSIFILT